MILKENLSDYTEQEFLEFLAEIDRANEDEPDEVLTPLLQHFRKVTEHPSGINLLYKLRPAKRVSQRKYSESSRNGVWLTVRMAASRPERHYSEVLITQALCLPHACN
ncbi:bacteriocin immunity protein [Pseudomonas faucium]|uniref:bacteriocin immunity protein n=1 Tax=Pseudomonas faucium TaxID=2740518 RepID=UPI00403B2C09